MTNSIYAIVIIGFMAAAYAPTSAYVPIGGWGDTRMQQSGWARDYVEQPGRFNDLQYQQQDQVVDPGFQIEEIRIFEQTQKPKPLALVKSFMDKFKVIGEVMDTHFFKGIMESGK